MPKTACAVFLCLLAASLCVAQHWEFEQVDTAPWGAGAKLASHPDGRMFLCYVNPVTGDIRVAYRDSSWHRQDLGVRAHEMWLLWESDWLSFDIGPNGEMGLIYLELGSWTMHLVEAEDSRWVDRALPFPCSNARLAYDTSGSPRVLFGQTHECGLAERRDTTWVLDSIAASEPGQTQLWVSWGIETGSDNRPRVLFQHHWEYSSSPYPFEQRLYLGARLGETWQIWFINGGDQRRTAAASLALDCGNTPSYCYCLRNDSFRSLGFYYNDTILDGSSTASALLLDSLDRPHIAYVGATLKYAYCSNDWHVCAVEQAGRPDFIAMMLDSAGQPVIAYCSRNGVWLAHGVDIVGVQETTKDERGTTSFGPSIVRGVLRLAERTSAGSSPSWLLDATGRRVMELAPGANDVSRFAPGVYFVRGRRSTRLVVAR